MPITLQDGFIVSANFPVDYRFTVDNVSDLNTITKLYVGLKTYVKSIDKTYVYTSKNQWKVDTGGPNVENHNDGIWTQNIFASGSVKRDNELFLGTVSNTKDDRSFYYNLWSRGLTDKDESRILNYSYRSKNGNDYDTMSHRIEQIFIPSGFDRRLGGAIDFNIKPEDSKTAMKGSVPLGLVLSVPLTSPNLPDVRTPKISFINDPSSIPSTNFYLNGVDFPSIKFTRDPTNINSVPVIPGESFYFGFNLLSEFASLPGYRMNFDGYNGKLNMGNSADKDNPFYDGLQKKNKWKFDLKLSDVANWTTMMEFDNQYPFTNFRKYNDGFNQQLDPIPSSAFKVLVDVSSKDWDTSSTRDFQLLTFPNIVRKIEHRYDRIQMWNHTSTYIIKNDILYLPTTANSFDVRMLSNDTKISDIRPMSLLSSVNDELTPQELRSTNERNFPVGTIINIRFTDRHRFEDGIKFIYRPSYLEIFNGTDPSNQSKIRSQITEATFEGLTYSKSGTGNPTLHTTGRINLWHHPNQNNLDEKFDNITFRRCDGYWEVVNLNRQSRINYRPWTIDYLDFEYRTGIQWLLQPDFNPVKIGPNTSYGYRFLDETNRWQYSNFFDEAYGYVDVDNTVDQYPKFQYPGEWNFNPNSSANGTDRWSNYLYGFRPRISVDGNRIVKFKGYWVLNVNPFVNGLLQRTYFRYSNSNIPNVKIPQIFFRSVENKKNIMILGFLTRYTDVTQPHLPKWEGNWTFVEMYGFGYDDNDQKIEITFSDCTFAIDTDGRMFLEFYAEPNSTSLISVMYNPYIEVYIPEFSYIANGPDTFIPNV